MTAVSFQPGGESEPRSTKPAVPEPAAPTRGWRRIAWWLVGAAFLALLVAGMWFAVRDQDWSVVTVVAERGDRRRIALLLAGGVLATAVGPLLGLLSWRALVLDVAGSITNAQSVRLFFVNFFAKYLPVKGLALVVALRMAKTSGMPLARLFAAGALSLGVTVLTGLSVGLLAGPSAIGTRTGWLALALVPIAVVLRWPHLVNHAAGAALRVLRRSPPKGAVSARGLRVAVFWQVAAWVVAGLHLWLLAIAMNAPVWRSLALCVGAYGLATVVGLLVVVVPDGIGVRESVLMAALAAVLPVPAAAVVVLASRLVTTVGEVAVGAVAFGAAEASYRRSARESLNEAG
ncbi:lysylphosphatidylglycerol synthase domain-containing protein [Actinomycetes bacterium KLBMP 9797]